MTAPLTHEPPLLWEALRALARAAPDAPALRAGALRLTRAALMTRAEALAHKLAGAGARPGDRIVGLDDNSPLMILGPLACARLGLAWCPLSPRSSDDELASQCASLAPRAVLVGVAHQHRLPARFARLDLDADAPDGASASRSRLDAPDGAPESIGLILTTSGTTGRGRSACHTQRAMAHNLAQFIAGLGLRAKDRALAVAPLSHVAGLNTVVMPTLCAGGEVVILSRFDPDQTLAALIQEQITVVFMVPTMWEALRHAEGFERASLSHVRVGLVGGAPCAGPLAEALIGRGVTLVNGYGMTEAGPMVTLWRWSLGAPPGTIGLPGAGVEVEVRDEDCAPVLAGALGQLWVRGPNLMAGVWRHAGAPLNRADFDARGWFATQDLGWYDPHFGFVLVGRRDDVIITGGLNVAPLEVEDALARAPGVRDVAVFASPHPYWGSQVTAAVVAEPGHAVTLEALRLACAGLARYKHPRRLMRVDALPRHGPGKVSRRALVAQWEAQHGRDE